MSTIEPTKAKRTIKIQVELTHEAYGMLQLLVRSGLHGEDTFKCAERLICERLRDLFRYPHG